MTALEQHRIAWPDKSDEWLFERLDRELKSKVDTIHNLLEENQKLNEALRWRDPEVELPEKDEMVLIKVQIRYTDTIVQVFPSIGILSECGLTHKIRLIDTHRSNGLIIGWRPIE